MSQEKTNSSQIKKPSSTGKLDKNKHSQSGEALNINLNDETIVPPRRKSKK